MSFLGRAKYNLLQYRKRDDPSLKVEEWQVRDYRNLKDEQLFCGLKGLGVLLDEAGLHQLAESGKSPEEIDLGLTG